MIPRTIDDPLCSLCHAASDSASMIQCDRCDALFHDSCVGIPGEAKQLALYWYCAECCRKFALVPVWKRKCRVPDCWNPARISQKSKYCCDDHGLAFFRIAAQRAEAVHPQDLSALLDFAGDAKAFRELEPTHDQNETEESMDDHKNGSLASDNELCNCVGCKKPINECPLHQGWKERERLLRDSAAPQLPLAWAAGVVRHTGDGGPNMFTPYVT